MKHYLLTVLIAINQLINAIFRGDEDEMISARAHRLNHFTDWAIAEILIDSFFFWDANHCRNAHNYEIEKALKRANKKS